MIIRYKLFESKNNPEIGDYVLVNLIGHLSSADDSGDNLKNILNKSIGVVIGKDFNNLFGEYQVEFRNILEYPIYNLSFKRNEIRSFSKDRKKLELELESEKYNI